jgi:hypothetical protein
MYKGYKIVTMVIQRNEEKITCTICALGKNKLSACVGCQFANIFLFPKARIPKS